MGWQEVGEQGEQVGDWHVTKSQLTTACDVQYVVEAWNQALVHLVLLFLLLLCTYIDLCEWKCMEYTMYEIITVSRVDIVYMHSTYLLLRSEIGIGLYIRADGYY